MGLKKGDIVTLYDDDGSSWPLFKRYDGKVGYMYLPSMIPKGFGEELEVHEEESKQHENTSNTYYLDLKTWVNGYKNR